VKETDMATPIQHEQEKREQEKREQEKREQEKREQEKREQDRHGKEAGIAGLGPSKDDLKREQDKGGKDPVGEAKEIGVEKVKNVETTKDEPYPTGEGPDPEAAFVAAHGFKRAKE
jgi:hypothetical protein